MTTGISETPQSNFPTHTPGPWWDDNGTIRSIERDEASPRGRRVAVVYIAPARLAEYMGNVALITEAPDLLAALKEAQRIASPINQSKYLSLIARAEGRQP